MSGTFNNFAVGLTIDVSIVALFYYLGYNTDFEGDFIFYYYRDAKLLYLLDYFDPN